MSIIKGLTRLLQHSVTNDLKARLTLRLTKELDNLEFDYSASELDTIINAVLETVGDFTTDTIKIGKDAWLIANTLEPKKRIRNPLR